MAEVLVNYTEWVAAPDGGIYRAVACGREMSDGRWEGWLEFTPAGGGRSLRSARETTQPNRIDTEYWATGLTPVYLEGALDRALSPAPAPQVRPAPRPAFEGPRPPGGRPTATSESVLDPFSVYRKGEDLLRRQLSAFADWHLVNILEAYGLSDETPEALSRRSPSELIELIVSGVRPTAGTMKG